MVYIAIFEEPDEVLCSALSACVEIPDFHIIQEIFERTFTSKGRQEHTHKNKGIS